MRRLYKVERWTLRRIAEKFGMTYQDVHYRLTQSAGFVRPTTVRRCGGPKLKALDPDELKRLYVDEQLPLCTVAKRCGVGDYIVVRELERLSIEQRDRAFYNRKYPRLG